MLLSPAESFGRQHASALSSRCAVEMGVEGGSMTVAAEPQSAGTVAGVQSAGDLNDRRYVTAAMMIVMVLSSMEMTITSTAMPTIIGDLHGLEHYAWVAAV